MKLILAFLLALTLPLAAQRKMGYIPDKNVVSPPFALKRGVASATIKPITDLTPLMPPIRDQGNLGSCVGHGVGRVLDYAHRQGGRKLYNPSPLFIYYNARVAINTVNEDSGAMIGDGVISTNTYGAASERCWPYKIEKFTVKPKSDCYKTALNKQAVKFYKVDNGDGVSIRKALSMGYPVVFGCYVSGEDIQNLTAKNDILPIPRGRVVDGHCMVIAGSHDPRQLYTIDNSWGEKHANKGRLRMPYAYIHSRKLTDDCWVIEIAE